MVIARTNNTDYDAWGKTTNDRTYARRCTFKVNDADRPNDIDEISSGLLAYLIKLRDDWSASEMRTTSARRRRAASKDGGGAQSAKIRWRLQRGLRCADKETTMCKPQTVGSETKSLSVRWKPEANSRRDASRLDNKLTNQICDLEKMKNIWLNIYL